jgi:predicted DNA repair protein MutK
VSVGLIALLDDVAGLAKMAAASVDDVIGQASRASAKSAAVVIDDTAVTPRYVVGLAAERELPIIAKIARGSIRNKLVFLLPIALLLALFAEWAITPLLMVGGTYLAYEGAEKVYEWLVPHGAHGHEQRLTPEAADAQEIEAQKVASAVKTDFILSAEIMTIALAAIPETTLWMRALVLAMVGVLITAVVYGVVALIVKADDLGVAMVRRADGSALGRLSRRVGLGLVRGMPYFLSGLAFVGTAAMIWVGGGILVHGLESFGVAQPGHLIEAVADAAAHAAPVLPGAVHWVVSAAGAGLVGLAVGFALIPLVGRIFGPLFRAYRRWRRGARRQVRGA